MATNLRNKIDKSDTMFIHDVNPAVTKKFADEVGNVTVAKDVREVAENTVCHATIPCHCTPFQDESILFYQ